MTESDDRDDLIRVFLEARTLLALPNNDYSWSSWESAHDAISEVNGIVLSLQSGHLPDMLTMQVLFAATGPMQEVSLSSGWSNSFLELAERFDAALKKAL